MTGTVCGNDNMANLFSLSRILRQAERIDFFMSHSWHDNNVLKFEKLQEIANRFFKKHNRFPTFWLDKVCIDQDAIADGLRALPINVMACSKFLVLCGASYPKRLWCVWELFTLFAFRSTSLAAECMEICFFGSDDSSNAWSQLLTFDVKDAHCFDPN